MVMVINEDGGDGGRRSGGSRGWWWGVDGGRMEKGRMKKKKENEGKKSLFNVTRDKKEMELITRGRHDPFVVPRVAIFRPHIIPI
ncbi:hypothetical protein TIFTF001_042548 [Ficus carica]|uniref:Uncharacterized protein n=1 Tax=Ficus carica TaxID=3494 RepID=A0AA88CYQ2_FICCA|nr:hypothetical protein TIFTF001_042545 [Ficus carica]GMN36971.1 hypothetical protein TIFTF001_042548 [Ficus carica]